MIGAVYRQDCASAHLYFVDLIENPPPVKLSAPVTVVVAADDPSTAGFHARYADWKLVAEHVELHALDDGGHYSLRTRPTEGAQAVVRAAELFATS